MIQQLVRLCRTLEPRVHQPTLTSCSPGVETTTSGPKISEDLVLEYFEGTPVTVILQKMAANNSGRPTTTSVGGLPIRGFGGPSDISDVLTFTGTVSSDSLTEPLTLAETNFLVKLIENYAKEFPNLEFGEPTDRAHRLQVWRIRVRECLRPIGARTTAWWQVPLNLADEAHEVYA